MKLHESVTKQKDINNFITLEERFKNIHGLKYDYSKVLFFGINTKVDIICAKHGVFSQFPHKHLCGNGCPKCAGKNKTTEEFLDEIINVHGDRYNYSLLKYVNVSTKLQIICKDHGVFEQMPSKHLCGKGCPKCVGKNKTTEEVINQFNIIHGLKYDYSLVHYELSRIKVNVICKDHGVFPVSVNNHLKGSGCPTCYKNKSHYDKYKNQHTTLYLIKINNFYKVGLTKTCVESRFKKEINNNVKIEIIKTVEFEDGWEAFKLEQKILKETIHLSISKEESPIKGGWTEVRKSDISKYVKRSLNLVYN